MKKEEEVYQKARASIQQDEKGRDFINLSQLAVACGVTTYQVEAILRSKWMTFASVEKRKS